MSRHRNQPSARPTRKVKHAIIGGQLGAVLVALGTLVTTRDIGHAVSHLADGALVGGAAGSAGYRAKERTPDA